MKKENNSVPYTTVGKMLVDGASIVLEKNIQPTKIVIPFNTIEVGTGNNKQQFDLIKIFRGLEKLGSK